MTRFAFSDAWLLHAVWVVSREGPGSLRDVIAAGDATNHAIFTPAELRRGFGRLIPRGYLESRGDGFAATRTGEALVEKASGQRRALIDVIERVWRSLEAEAPEADADADWPLSDAAIEAAIRDYAGPPG